MARFYNAETNAFYSENLCYTEDGVPVYNLYIAKIPKNATKDTLREYFSKFGEVASVTIARRRRGRSYKYGFVNFVSKEAATNALMHSCHFIEDRYLLKVEAAYSWRQPPKKMNATTINQETKDNDNETKRTSLLILNDDCLLHIFSFLPIGDRFRLSRVCQRFQKVFEMFLRLEKQINSEMVESLTLMQVKELLHQYGTLVQKVQLCGRMLHSKKWRLVDSFIRFCTNLQSLKLNGITGLHINSFKKLSTHLVNLRELKLANCFITDKTCSHLAKLNNLQVLDLSNNYELTGRELYMFKHLIELNLSHCSNIQSKHFSSFCQNSKLKVLDIFKCDRLSKTAITDLSSNLKDLEKLTISTSYQTDELASIAELKNLKSLTIQCTNYVRNDIFEELAKNKSDTLEELAVIYVNLNEVQKNCIYKLKKLKKLSVPCVNEVDDIFLKKIAELPELKELHLPYCDEISQKGVVSIFDISKSIEYIDVSCCKQFNSEFVIALVEKIKDKRKHVPCKVVVGSTMVEKNIVQNSKYIADGKLVPLSFETPNRYYQIDGFEYDDDYDDDDDDDFGYDYDFDYYDSDDNFLADLGNDDFEGYYYINNSLHDFLI